MNEYGSITIDRDSDGTLHVIGEVPDRLGVCRELLCDLNGLGSYGGGRLSIAGYWFAEIGPSIKDPGVIVFERLTSPPVTHAERRTLMNLLSRGYVIE